MELVYKIAIHPQCGKIKFALPSEDIKMDSDVCFKYSILNNKRFFIPAEYAEDNIKTILPVDGWIIDSYEDETYSKRTERLDYSAFKTYALN